MLMSQLHYTVYFALRVAMGCTRRFFFAISVVLCAGQFAAAQDVFTTSDLQDALQTAVGCDLSARVRADLEVVPLYTMADSGCESAVPRESGTYYRDAACLSPIQFTQTPQRDFCFQATSTSQLGERGAEAESVWTLSPGSTYQISARSLNGMKQPYRKSVVYRTIATVSGECQLLMRIYKSDLRSDVVRPALLALHGGSWSSRGFGAFGIEVTATQYVDEGFVVFAPFYRLLGNNEGSAACGGATLAQIIEDASAALNWVQENAADYGAQVQPVVFGQSAGAHLALSLAVNRPADVAAAVLFYPPTDFSDFLLQMRSGDYTTSSGIALMNQVVGDPLTVSLDESPVPENSYPQRIGQQSASLPAMKILHGLEDDLVPARQSVRLCNALAGRALSDSPATGDRLQADIDCGGSSALTLFQQGAHALDVCITTDLLLSALVPEICLSGDDNSRQLLAAELARTADWARASVSAGNSENDGGSGSVSHVLLLLLLILRCCGSRWPRVTGL